MLHVLLPVVLAASPAPAKAAAVDTASRSVLPVEGKITSPYGWRKTDCLFHPGIDIAAKVGTPVRAPADGTVFYAGNSRDPIGMAIVLGHVDGMSTVYGHLSKLLVARGATVRKGDVIGLTGKSGNARGPHLHWEIHWNNRARNPLTWLRLLENAEESALQGSGAFSPSPSVRP